MKMMENTFSVGLRGKTWAAFPHDRAQLLNRFHSEPMHLHCVEARGEIKSDGGALGRIAISILDKTFGATSCPACPVDASLLRLRGGVRAKSGPWRIKGAQKRLGPRASGLCCGNIAGGKAFEVTQPMQ
ncbi:hypothetical protein ACFSM0_04915 [Rhodobacter lacus]|uniref:Uncharacterized protein n=1 Tax=Rhodobacter lacus TaxID=1641972 RepID=A0ABW5A6G1_9RHOB